MTTDYIIIAIGSFLSLALVIIAWKIYSNSLILKRRLKYFNIEKREEVIIQTLTKHFEISLMNKIYDSETDKVFIYKMFKVELEKILHTTNIISDIQLRQISILLETFQAIHFENKMISNLQEKERGIFIQESTKLYVMLMKFVVYKYYTRRKEKQLDFNFDEQIFDILNYRLKLTKGEEGIDEITVDE